MVNGWSIPPLLMASINAYLAAHFLVIHIRTRMSREVLSFAHLAFALCLYDVCCAFLYSAPSPEAGRLWQLLQVGVLSFGAIGLLVFAARYTNRRPGRFLVGVSIGFGAVLVAALLGGFDLLFTEVPLVKHLSLPFGLSATYNEVAAGPLSAVHDLVSLSVFVFVFAAGAAQYRSGERRRARLLLAATGILFIAALNDAALGTGLIHSVYLIEYAFMGMVILMADSLSKQLVRVARIDEALRQSERNYREVFDATGDAIFVHDAETGAILDLNATMLDLFGYTRDEALRLTMADLSPRHPPHVQQEIEARIRRAGDEGPQVFEWLARRKNGQEFWTEVALRRSLIGGQGRVLAVVRDISERKLAESSQAAIYAISEAAQHATNLEGLFAAIHGIVGRLMEARNLYVALHDPVADLISYPYYVDEEDNPPGPEPPGRGLTAYVLRTGKPLLATPEVFEELRRRGEVEEIGAPSIDWLGVPLVFGDQTLGVFAVQTYTEGVRYGEREKDILTFVSRQVALAIGRKRAEEQLQRSEQDYRSVVENANEAIIISQEGVLQYVNPSTVALSGYSESDLLGKPLLGFVHADDRDMVLTNYKRRMQGFEVPTVYELRLTTKNCDVKWAKNSAVMVNWGGMPAVLHFLTDITERKLAEDALRESEQLVRSVLDAMADAVIITDPQGHALFVNPAAARIADLPSPEAAAGVSVLDFVCTDDREAALRDLALMSAGTQPSPGRYRQRTASGKERWIEALGTTIRFKKEPAYLLTVRDITERMHLEIQLRQAQKMEAVGRLAGGIAHDFNNVLQALLSLSQALPSQLTDPVRFGATSLELQEQVKRGAALTRQLLLFSRQEARRLERLDLKQVVRQFSQMMRLVRENVWVSLELGDGSIPVMGDRGQLEQVLMNLVVNAADAMPQGGRLTIRARTEGGNAILEVMDTGTGMTEETKARLFEPFFTTKDASRGTGLGLSVVHGIVTGHGGSVEAESQVNQGSTLRVVLPTTTNPEAEVEPGAVGGRARLAVGGGERVLVVEDETGAREGLQQVLTMLGYRVTAVGSGAEADALAPEPGFDLLLTDYLLPDVLGTDLAVRLQERWPAVKVVLMSGYAQDEAVRRRISQGELRFLQKPFDMATVARELRDALASHATLGTE